MLWPAACMALHGRLDSGPPVGPSRAPLAFAKTGGSMIRLTRLNQSQVVINAEMIEFVEAIPDTIVSLSPARS